MKHWVWTWVALIGVLAAVVGCQVPESPEAQEVELVLQAEAPAAAEAEEAVTAAREVLFSEDFESGGAGRWSSVTVVEGGAGGSKYAAQGTVAEGKNAEYWGLDVAVDDALTLSLDIFFEGPVTELQIMTFAKNASNNFRFQQADLGPGRWHHIEATLADFFSWDGGSLVGDTIQSINIWVQGTAGDAFRVDNIVVYR